MVEWVRWDGVRRVGIGRMSGCWCGGGDEDEDGIGWQSAGEGWKRREESFEGCAMPDTAPKTHILARYDEEFARDEGSNCRPLNDCKEGSGATKVAD